MQNVWRCCSSCGQAACAIAGHIKPGAYQGRIYGGAIGPWPPPFGSPGQYNYHRIVCKIAACPPPLCELGRSFEHTKGRQRPFFWPAPNFGQNLGLNLSEDLFFLFCSSPNFGQKIGLNLCEDLFFLALHQIWAKNRTKFE